MDDVLAEAHACALFFIAQYERRLGLDRGSLSPWAGTFITDLTSALPHHTTLKFP